MKKLLLLMMMASSVICSKAQQVSVEEPEFADQTLILISDSVGKMLPRENVALKTKASASLYLAGVGKIKTRITLTGEHSSVVVKQESVIRLIVKAADNKTDPKSFIRLFKFEEKVNKRQALVAETGTFSGASTNSLSNIDYNANKYGESSYLIYLENLEPGEYGLLLGDPNSLTGKNSFLVTTFCVTADGNTPASRKNRWEGKNRWEEYNDNV